MNYIIQMDDLSHSSQSTCLKTSINEKSYDFRTWLMDHEVSLVILSKTICEMHGKWSSNSWILIYRAFQTFEIESSIQFHYSSCTFMGRHNQESYALATFKLLHIHEKRDMCCSARNSRHHQYIQLSLHACAPACLCQEIV